MRVQAIYYERVAHYPYSVSVSAPGTQLSPVPSVGLSVYLSACLTMGPESVLWQND